MQGRCAALRIQAGHMDIMAILGYFPPWNREARSKAAHLSTVTAVNKWIVERLNDTASRPLPLLGMDLNDNFGWCKIEGETVEVRSDAIGEFDRGSEGGSLESMSANVKCTRGG